MSSNVKDDQQRAVDPKELLDFLRGLRMQALRLRRLEVHAERDFAHTEMRNLDHRETHGYEAAEGGLLRIDIRHVVRLVGRRKKTLGSVAATFSWYYLSEKPADDQILREFLPMVRFQTWPHLRELVQSVAQRANWPRLTLPLLIAPPKGPEV